MSKTQVTNNTSAVLRLAGAISPHTISTGTMIGKKASRKLDIDFAFSGHVLFAVGPAEETASAWITDDLRLALEANAGDVMKFVVSGGVSEVDE